MDKIIAILFVAVLGAEMTEGFKIGKWHKMGEDSYEQIENLMKGPIFKAKFMESDKPCSEADWEIGNAYTKITYDVGSSVPTGRAYLAEILCPFTEQEIYSLYLMWTASLLPENTIEPNYGSIQYMADLTQVSEVDQHVSTLVGLETALYDVMDMWQYILVSLQESLCYYSGEACTKKASEVPAASK